MPKTTHFTVCGRVQGVGYRYSTRNKAIALGLTGWVRNMANGNVEGIAQGSEDSIDLFKAWLRRGPDHAQVSSVDFKTIEREPLREFQINR